MDLETAYSLGLPKWPQLYITGPDVSVEEAKAIIFKNETFLTSLGSSGGNNHEWNRWAVNLMGLTAVSARYEGGTLDWEDGARSQALLRLGWAIREKWREERAIRTNYVYIDRASCSFIGGPHGWCSPEGKIYYDDNVGKWPSVAEVHADLVSIAEAFPFVKMAATLFDGESCTDGRRPVVTFQVANGTATVADYECGDTAQLSLHTIQEDTSPGSGEARVQSMVSNFLARREQGLPDSWIVDFAQGVRAWLPGAVEEILRDWKSDDVKLVEPSMRALLPNGVPPGRADRPDDLREEVADVVERAARLT